MISMLTTPTPQIFLSYSNEDRYLAADVRNCLLNAGFDVWWDQLLVPGQPFNQAIHNQLNQAAAIVVVWSRTSVASPYVQAEALFGFENHNLVPIRIDDCQLIYPFAMLQTADMRQPNWCGTLVEALRGLCQFQFAQGGAEDPLEVPGAIYSGDLVYVVQQAGCAGELREPFGASEVRAFLRERNYPEQQLRYIPQMLANHAEGNNHPTTGRARFRRVARGSYQSICPAIP